MWNGVITNAGAALLASWATGGTLSEGGVQNGFLLRRERGVIRGMTAGQTAEIL